MCAIRRIRGTDEWIVQSPPSHGSKTYRGFTKEGAISFANENGWPIMMMSK